MPTLGEATWDQLVREMKARCAAMIIVAEQKSQTTPGDVVTSIDYMASYAHAFGLLEYGRVRISRAINEAEITPDNDRPFD